jgi:hypothetical protein
LCAWHAGWDVVLAAASEVLAAQTTASTTPAGGDAVGRVSGLVTQLAEEARAVAVAQVPSPLPAALADNDAEAPLSATHVRQALYDPNSTYPPPANNQLKTIPSLNGSGRPLRRNPDQANIDRNRGKACKSIDRKYADGGNKCEEFPSASTNEGAANNSGTDFSVKVIPATDNGAGGTTSEGGTTRCGSSRATPSGWM